MKIGRFVRTLGHLMQIYRFVTSYKTRQAGTNSLRVTEVSRESHLGLLHLLTLVPVVSLGQYRLCLSSDAGSEIVSRGGYLECGCPRDDIIQSCLIEFVR
jgi:hypothetical protein